MPRGKSKKNEKSRNITRAEREARRLQSERDKATNAMLAIRGHGGYKETLGSIVPAGTFAKGGSAAGGALGQFLGDRVGLGGAGRAIGRLAGGGLGGLLSKIAGFGDYTVQSNSLLNGGVSLPEGEPVPQFVSGGHSVRIQHREFLGNVRVPTVPTDFTTTRYRFNPADAATFPWFSDVAWPYQQYRVHGAAFVYKSMSSSTVTAGGPLGTVAFTTNSNAADPAPVDMMAVANNQYSTTAKPSEGMVHAIECAPNLNADPVRYIGDEDTAAESPQWYDWCNTYVVTEGLPGSAGDILGEIWLTYDIELIKPRIPPYHLGNGCLLANTADGLTKGIMLGTEAEPAYQAGIISRQSNNNLRVTAPGTYMLVIVSQFSGAFTGTASAAIPAGSAAVATISTQLAPWVTDNATEYVVSYFVNGTAPFSVQLNGSGFNIDPDGVLIYAFEFPQLWLDGMS